MKSTDILFAVTAGFLSFVYDNVCQVAVNPISSVIFFFAELYCLCAVVCVVF